MYTHYIHRRAKAQQAINPDLSFPLCLRQADHRPLGVEHSGQVTHDAEETGNHTNPDSEHELDLQVTDSKAWPPIADIVGGPDEGVDQVHEIGEHNVEDESGGGEIAVADVPDEGWKIDDQGDQGERWECNGCR